MDVLRRIRARRAARAPRDEQGFTLLEISVATMLLGLSSLVILGGLFTIVRSSQISTDQARAEAVLGNAADRLTNEPYTPCPPASGPGSYLAVAQAAASSVGWPPSTVTIVSLEYYDPTGTTDQWSNSNTASGVGCNPSVSGTSPRTIQKLILQVQAPNGSFGRQLEVVKNNVLPDVSAP